MVQHFTDTPLIHFTPSEQRKEGNKVKKARCSILPTPTLGHTQQGTKTYMPELWHSGLGVPQTFSCGFLRRSCSASVQVKSSNCLLCGPPTLGSGRSQPKFSSRHLHLQQKTGTLNSHMKDNNSKAAENAHEHKIITRSLSGLPHVANNINC